MLQYFFIVSHSGSDEIRINDKVFMQEEQAINWGRKQATKFPLNDYWLQRCPITATGTVTDYKSLLPFRTQNFLHLKLQYHGINSNYTVKI